MIKTILYRFLSFFLVFLLIFPATQAENSRDFEYVVVAGWDDYVRENAETAGGGFRRISDELPLQIWIPESMTEKETGSDAEGGKVISSWFCSFCNADIDFIFYPEPPLSRSAETVEEHYDPDNESYACLNLINDIPALDISFWEPTNPDNLLEDVYQREYMYYYLDDGSCFLIRARYLIEETDNAEYTMSILDYSLSPAS